MKYEMMSYKIIFDTSPILKKDLSLLKKNKKQVLLIKEKIEEFAENPNEFIWNIKKLKPKQENLYRIRVWNYRVIISKDDWNKILIVHRIWLRWSIYKSR